MNALLRRFSMRGRGLLLVSFAMLQNCAVARAQIFVTNLNNSTIDIGRGTVGEYGLDGSTINPALISGLDLPMGIVVAGTDIFIVRPGDTIGKYTTSGTIVDANFLAAGAFPTTLARNGMSLYVVSTLGSVVGRYSTAGAVINENFIVDFAGDINNGPLATGITVSPDGSRLYIANNGDDTLGVYDSDTGATIHDALITGLNHPTGVAVSSTNIFVANSGNGTIGKYNLDGTVVNASFISGLDNPVDLAEFDGDLFVVNNGTNSIGEYDATSGTAVNAALITGLSDPQGIAIVPEPSTFELVFAAAISLMLYAWRFKRHPRATEPRPFKTGGPAGNRPGHEAGVGCPMNLARSEGPTQGSRHKSAGPSDLKFFWSRLTPILRSGLLHSGPPALRAYRSA